MTAPLPEDPVAWTPPPGRRSATRTVNLVFGGLVLVMVVLVVVVVVTLGS